METKPNIYASFVCQILWWKKKFIGLPSESSQTGAVLHTTNKEKNTFQPWLYHLNRKIIQALWYGSPLRGECELWTSKQILSKSVSQAHPRLANSSMTSLVMILNTFAMSVHSEHRTWRCAMAKILRVVGLQCHESLGRLVSFWNLSKKKTFFKFQGHVQKKQKKMSRKSKKTNITHPQVKQFLKCVVFSVFWLCRGRWIWGTVPPIPYFFGLFVSNIYDIHICFIRKSLSPEHVLQIISTSSGQIRWQENDLFFSGWPFCQIASIKKLHQASFLALSDLICLRRSKKNMARVLFGDLHVISFSDMREVAVILGTPKILNWKLRDSGSSCWRLNREAGIVGLHVGHLRRRLG